MAALMCVQTFGTALEFKADLRAFDQGAKAVAFDGRVVHENIFVTALRNNEPKPLLVIEPFDFAFDS